MSNLIRNQLPLTIISIILIVIFTDYFLALPPSISNFVSGLQQWIVILAAFALVLGAFNIVKIHLPKIRKSIWKIYLAPLFNFLIVILIVSAIIISILGSPESTIITFTVVIINSLTAIVQQFRAQKALESLKKITALKASVIRDGEQYEISNRELVPGDIVIIDQGDKVPADGRIINFVNLTIDEAPLTGESEPIEKTNNIIENREVHIQNQINMVFMGTYVRTGRAKVLITNTGGKTELGKISQTLNEMGSIEDIPLTRTQYCYLC